MMNHENIRSGAVMQGDEAGNLEILDNTPANWV